MIQDAQNYYAFIDHIETKIKELKTIALDVRTPFDATQSARLRLKQLQDVYDLAVGEAVKL